MRAASTAARPFKTRRFRGVLARLTVAWWIFCLGVIFASLLKADPELSGRLVRLTRDPAMDLTAPFPNCDAAHAAGVYDIPRSSPAYSPYQDGDSDGLACEPHRY